MDAIKGLFGGVVGLVWVFAGPVTYILNVVDTWGSRSPVIVKLLINLTLDVVLALIWPITWLIWAVQLMMDIECTPSRLLGW